MIKKKKICYIYIYIILLRNRRTNKFPIVMTKQWSNLGTIYKLFSIAIMIDLTEEIKKINICYQEN
jgi:hypothetical protein